MRESRVLYLHKLRAKTAYPKVRENFRILRKVGNWVGIVILLISLFGIGSEIFRIMGAEPIHGGPSRALTASFISGVWTFLWIFLWFGLVFVVSSAAELLCDIADVCIERNRGKENTVE